jgi:protein-S-isoprenylcysteine O-methyltransferase Ste14
LPLHTIIGTVLFVVGLGIATVAQATLWRGYSGTLMIRENHKLKTGGLYRLVRQPAVYGRHHRHYRSPDLR